MNKTFLEFLNEVRDSTKVYTEKKVKDKIDKVTLELKDNDSGKFTKLIKEYAKLKESISDLEIRQKELNTKIKAETEELFDAEDVIYTRVIDTVSATLSLSKKTVVTTTKVDYQKIIDSISELVPELTDKINLLIEANTKISTAERSPALRVDLKEGFLDWIKSLYTKIKSWCLSYDKKLDAINSAIDNL